MFGALLVGLSALSIALVAGALLDTADRQPQASPGQNELRRSSLQFDPVPRCCS